uniref:Uncharacterized protein n=1 Tax=viral metagenome TaxID=1070528 RepID=A0A6C0AP53_9ZZZZ
MIVIPPAVELEEYFMRLAKATWTKYTYNEADGEDEIKKKHKTLVISCDLDMLEEKVAVKLHYRFIRDTLYCFIEEIGN